MKRQSLVNLRRWNKRINYKNKVMTGEGDKKVNQ